MNDQVEILQRNKPKVVAFVGIYLPGFKGGGPIRTIKNTIDHLSDKFSFYVLTRDRDLGDVIPYANVKLDCWIKNKNCSIYYLPSNEPRFFKIRRIVLDVKPDIIYLNSFFDPKFTITPLLLRRLGLISKRIPVIIAPRGEMSPNALKLKNTKKFLYMFFAKMIGLYKGLIWQASSVYEKNDIQKSMRNNCSVFVTPNLPPKLNEKSKETFYKEKSDTCLDILFVSRIVKNKNLDYALEILKRVRANVRFNIYGILEDKVYWEYCSKIIDEMPSNILVKYCGSLSHNEVVTAMSQHDLFFFPTQFENYGHVILEAFLAGCPVLISDRTPWRNLEQYGVGWDISLDKRNRFQEIIEKCAHMDRGTFRNHSDKAREYGAHIVNGQDSIKKNLSLFWHVCG